MIKIYLNCPRSQIPFLSIPLSDVLRLSIRPLKWLRYVMFSICGARGELSTGPEGPVVDYETTALVDDRIYYYITSGKVSCCTRDGCSPRHIPVSPELCHFIDYQGLNDRVTTTTHSDQSSGCTEFRDRILERDGSTCVVTHEVVEGCDAAHLIPGSKTDEVAFMIIQCGSSLIVSYRTFSGFSKIALPFMAIWHTQFVVLMLLRMECCCPRICMHVLVKERPPS